MAGPENQFEVLARDAAERIAESRELAQQLSLLPDEQPGAALVEDGSRKGRGQGKAVSQMREWLAAKGYRLPEDVLAEMAGMASRDDAILTAMAQAEQVLAWAGRGAINRKFLVGVGHVDIEGPWLPTPDQRLTTFMQLYTIMLRASEALLPYGAPKAAPDVALTQVNQIVLPANTAPAQAPRGGDVARDITPGARRIGPPPMPHQMQRNQSLSDAAADAAESARRTDEASQ